MRNSKFIDVADFCALHYVDPKFIESLNAHGLFRTEKTPKTTFFAANHLPALEKYVRLHHELQVNTAGLQTLSNSLNEKESIHEKVSVLETKMEYYEQLAPSQAIDL